MPRYKAVVAGPVSLEDGRIVTSESPFDLTIETPHDEQLLESGQIIAVERDPKPAKSIGEAE